VLVHGSSGSSLQMHVAAKALAAAGVTVVSPDIRGHGDSGKRGDIAYYGQLENDMEDLAAMLANRFPQERRILIGHSSGGAFVLRIANERGDQFDGYIALSPMLAGDAPTTRTGSGGWVCVSVPRIMGLVALNRLGVHVFNGLPVLAFAIPQGAEGVLTQTYSFNLMRNFGLPPQGWRQALRAIRRPTVVLVAGQDEMMKSDQYAPLLATLNPIIVVRIVPGAEHMGMTFKPSALDALVKTSRRLLG
jgi:pimeloyl-ACP methyl ester carboxylesterase